METLIPTITQAYPPLALNELVNLINNFDSASAAEKRRFIRQLVQIHPILNLKWGSDWRYRRVRVLEKNDVPKKVEDLIWQKNVAAKLGRANPAGFSVLYLSGQLDTALSEARVENHPIVIAEFQILANQSMQVAPIGELVRVQRTGRGFMLGEASSTVTDLLNACNAEDAKSLLIADSFLSQCLTNIKDDYELSSTVAMCIFEKRPNITAIAYPSRRQFGGLNFAVRVEHFWNNWGIHSVRRCNCAHLAQGYYRLHNVIHVNGITTSGKLRWCEEPDPLENAVLQLQPLWTPL